MVVEIKIRMSSRRYDSRVFFLLPQYGLIHNFTVVSCLSPSPCTFNIVNCTCIEVIESIEVFTKKNVAVYHELSPKYIASAQSSLIALSAVRR